MARNLRAKLQYAQYKVRRNVIHKTFEELSSELALPDSHAFVAAATAAANGPSNPASAQSRGSMAPPSAVPARVPTSNLRGPPRSIADRGADARQTLYASILAQPPTRRARTIMTAQTQPAPVPSGSKQSGFKRKVPASDSRSKASKRKRGDDTAVASHDDLRAAAMLTDLSRSNINAGNVERPLSQASHVPALSDTIAGQSSLGYQQSSTDASLTQSAAVAPAHSTSPSTLSHVEASRLRCTVAVSTSVAASTPSSAQHPTATSARLGDQEAVRLLYYLYESPSSAYPEVGATAPRT